MRCTPPVPILTAARNWLNDLGKKLLKTDVTEPDEILLSIMSNILSKQAYMKGFDCNSIDFKKSVIMFETIDIGKSILKVVV